jgi:MoaA/NifB/PqqE/SkfB family radical SAM enzyme
VDYPYFADFGLLWCASLASRAGWNVRVADSFAMRGSGRFRDGEGFLLGLTEESLLAGLPEGAFDVVVLGASPFLRPWNPDPRTRMLVDRIRSDHPESVLVLAECHVAGMHHVSWDPDVVFQRLPALDVLVRYAGESVFADPGRLVGMQGSRLVLDAPALSWDTVGPAFPMFESLDTVEWGAFLWRCFADNEWANPFQVDATTRPFLTSSGCSHRCTFCSSNAGYRTVGRKHHRIVPLEVAEQWAYLASRGFGARKLFIMDDVANLRPDFEDMLDILDRLDLLYEFPNGLRADRLSNRAIARMKDRISMLSVSAESASAEHLAGPIGKRLDPAEVERVVAESARHGIPTLVHFMIGFPWETRQDVMRTLEFAWKLFERHGAQPAVQFATPLPGTDLHEQCIREGLLPPGGLDLSDGNLFQHKPAFKPAAIPEGWLEMARSSLDDKAHAARARKVIVNITYECINKCEFCAVSNRVRRGIVWERIQEILQFYRDKGYDQLDIDGGEPTLHPRLLDAVAYARQLGYRGINVMSNGRRLANPAEALRLLDSGVTSVLISLHGDSAEIHDPITGVPGSFEETITGIRNIRAFLRPEQGCAVNVTITKRNVDRLMALTELIHREGVRTLNIQFLTPFGSAAVGIVPPPEEAAAAVRAVIDRFGDDLRIFVVNAQFCLFPGYEHHLLGDLQKLGRTMVFVTDEEVNLFEYLASRRIRDERCEACPHGLVCEGFYAFTEGASDA